MTMFRALASRNFKLFISGQSVSLVGTWMQKIAISWLVYRLTGSPFILGLTLFASLIPSLFLSPYAGSFADRHNRYKILLVSQCVLMLQSGILAALVFAKLYHIPLILTLCVVQGIASAFDTTSRQSLLIAMVDRKEDLPNAIALNSSMTNLARLLGPALAGILLSLWGEEACFSINFLSYFFVIFSLSRMKLDLPQPKKKDHNIWQTLREGYFYLKSVPDISYLIRLLTVYSLLVIPYSTLLPIFAKDVFHGGPKVFSWFESAAGLGAFIGSFYVASLRSSSRMLKIVIAAGLIFSTALIMLSLTKALSLAVLFTGISGLGMMIFTSAINTFIQTHVADFMRGRIISYFIMSYQGVLPIGSLLTGSLAGWVGAEVTVAVTGIAGISAIIIYAFFKRRRSRRMHAHRKQYLSRREHQVH